MIKKTPTLFKLGIIITSVAPFSAIATAPGAGKPAVPIAPPNPPKPNWKPKHLAYSFKKDVNIPIEPKHRFHKSNMHKIKFDTKMKTSIKLSRWVDDDLPSSNPTNVNQQLVMYEDSRGNLWATSKGKKLYKYNYDDNTWKLDSTSNITDGGEGVIFGDSRGNLWAAGKGTRLQKYDYDTKHWNDDTSSNINDGYRGVLYEDSQGRLWAIGLWKALQRYNYNKNEWVTETNGNNVRNIRLSMSELYKQKYKAIIYEDSYGNIWTVRYRDRLQKLEYKKNYWTSTSIDNRSISSRHGAYLFEDSYDRLWYIRANSYSWKNGYTIHYYDYKTKTWNKRNYWFANSKGASRFSDYNQSVIFESSFRQKLFMMADDTPIHNFNEYILTRYRNLKDTNQDIKKKPKLKGAWRKHWYLRENSGINNGNYGKIWEDQWQNIWFTAENSKLTSMRPHFNRYVTDDFWTLEWDYKFNDWAAKNGNKITNGQNGVFFQDSRGNIWSSGVSSPLQKLVPQAVRDKKNWETKRFRGWFMTHLLPDSKISVWISGYHKYTSDKYTHLRYRKNGEAKWKIVKTKKLILENGDYEFKWEIGSDEELSWFKKYEGSEQTKPSRWYVKNNGKIEEKLSLHDLARFPWAMHKPTKKVMAYVNNGQKPQAKDLNHPQRIGYNFKFKLATPTNENGESIVTYAVNTIENPGIVKYISFTIVGFEKRDDVNFRKSFVNLEPSAISIKPTKIRNFKSGQKVLKNSVTLPYHYGYKFAFKSATTVDSSNNSLVTYYISPIAKPGLKKEMTFLVDTIESFNARSLRQLDASSITRPTKNPSANLNNGEKPQASDFTIPKHSGYIFTFKKASSIDEDGKSKVTYEIFKTGEPNIKKVMTFNVDGFETKEAKIKRVAKQELLNLGPEDITEKPQASRSYSLKQGQKPKYYHFFHPKHSGYIFQFKAANGVSANEEGVMATATYFVWSIKEGLKTKHKITFTNIGGFVTKKETDLKSLVARDVTIQPTKISGSIPTQITSGNVNPPHHLGYTFTFKSGEKLDSNPNTWKVTYTVKDASNEDLKKELTFDVVNEEASIAKELRELDISSITKPTKKPSASAKFYHSPLGTDFVVPTRNGYTFNFMGATKVGVNGDTKVNYEIFKDTATDTKKAITFVVSGFEKQVDAIKRIALENLKQLTSNNVITKPIKKISSNAFFSKKPTQADIDEPIHEGMIFTFKSATKINEWGRSDVTYSVRSSLPEVVEEKDITFKNVYGFKNKWATIMPEDIAEVKKFVANLANSNFSSLANPNKIVDVVTKAEILEKIKVASGYSSLTPVQQGLIAEDLIVATNDPDGTLKIAIIFVDGQTYEYLVSGFKLSRIHNVEQVKAFLGGLNNSSISSLAMATKLVSQVTKTEILAEIKLASGYSALTNAQKALITANLITKTNDPDGTLKVKINYEGEQYELSVNGFLKVADDNIAKVKTFLKSLDNSSISSLAIATKLVSQVTKTEIFEQIKTTNSYKALTNEQKALVIANLITKSEDPGGTLKVIINYESEKYELSASGFLTVAANNIAKVKAFLNTLSSKTISSLANSPKLVNAITKTEVLALIQAAKGYNDLTKDQKALITKDLISLSEEPAGTLKVAISFQNETYEFAKDGLKLTLEAEANKFQDFTSTDNIKSNAASLKVSSKNVLNVFKKISGYQRPNNLTSDIAITKVIVKNALNPQSRKVTFELTISRQNEIAKKDVAVTFKDLKVIAKPSKKGSGGLSTGAIVGISLGSILGIGLIGFLIFKLVRRNKN